MFASRIRNAALALTFAVVAATTVVSPVAAAPADSQPESWAAETVAAKPRIDVARADGEILFVTSYGNGSGTTAVFVIKNNGPERAVFNYRLGMTYRLCQNCEMTQAETKNSVTLDSGASATVVVWGDCQGTLCLSTGGTLQTLGLDSNQSNNADYHSFIGS